MQQNRCVAHWRSSMQRNQYTSCRRMQVFFQKPSPLMLNTPTWWKVGTNGWDWACCSVEKKFKQDEAPSQTALSSEHNILSRPSRGYLPELPAQKSPLLPPFRKKSEWEWAPEHTTHRQGQVSGWERLPREVDAPSLVRPRLDDPWSNLV